MLKSDFAPVNLCWSERSSLLHFHQSLIELGLELWMFSTKQLVETIISF